MTVPINLLPWREHLRQQRRRHLLLSLSATMALVIGSALLVAQHHRLAIREQIASNDQLRSDIARVTASIEEMEHLQQRDRDIAERLASLQQLQGYRDEQARIFEIMARAVPPQVQLTVLRRRGQSLQVEGIASTHAAVAQLLRTLAAEGGVRPSLHRISAVAGEAGDTSAGKAFFLTLEPAANPEVAVAARSE